MPRVASEPSLVHAPHNHLGLRNRSVGNDAREAASPFALLVDSAQATPPAKDHPAARAPTSRPSSSEDAPPHPCTDLPSLPARLDDATGAIPSVQIPEPVRAPVEGADGATAGKAAPTCAEDATTAQADTLEAAVLVATASPVDATAAQSIPAVAPAAPPSPPPAPSPTLPDSVPMATGAIPTPVGKRKVRTRRRRLIYFPTS